MEWEAWSTCSATCGEGERSRKRYCLKGQRMRSRSRYSMSMPKTCGQDGIFTESGKCRSGIPCHGKLNLYFKVVGSQWVRRLQKRNLDLGFCCPIGL